MVSGIESNSARSRVEPVIVVVVSVGGQQWSNKVRKIERSALCSRCLGFNLGKSSSAESIVSRRDHTVNQAFSGAEVGLYRCSGFWVGHGPLVFGALCCDVTGQLEPQERELEEGGRKRR